MLPPLIKWEPRGLVTYTGISRLTTAKLTSSSRFNKVQFGNPLLLLSNVRRKESVQRRLHSPEAEKRETASSNLLRARTEYTDLKHEGHRLCYAVRV